MPRFAGRTDRTNRVFIEPAITRAFWSLRRAWNGADVKLFIETKWVKDGTPVKVQVWEDDSGEGSADDFIVELDDNYKITGNKCTIEYQLRWDAEALGREAASEGGELEFYFKVMIEDLALVGRSNLLLVDLAGFNFSS